MSDSDITTLIWNVQQLQLDRYFHAALLTIYIVDYFNTLTTEIESLWPASWTTVKVVFLFARYLPFVDVPISIATNYPMASANLCAPILRLQLWSAAIGITSSHLLLLFRVYALIGRTRLSAIILSLLALVIVATTCLFTPLVQKDIQVADLSVPSIFPTCFIVVNHWFTAVVAPIVTMFYETLIFGVMCWVKVTRYNNDRNWLAEKIYRDVFMYYFAVLAIAVATTILWFVTTGPLRDLSSTIPRCFVTMISCRIILNIRKYARLPIEGRTTSSGGPGGVTQPVSGLRFASAAQESGVDTELRLR